MHEAGYRVLGLPWRYMPFEVDETTLASAVASMRPLKIRGFGVSMPFKESVVSLVDRVEDRARRIGAVNTIVNDAGTLVGHNTDWVGAVRALEEVRALRGARALVLGAGGAARAVAFGLVESGASVTLCNRTLDRARALGEALGVGHIAWEERRDAARYDILVNASSLGMKDVDPTSPMPRDSLGPNLVVMDIVYKPVETELVRDARARRAGTIHGGRMLLHQAAAQFELYTGRRAPLDALDNALRAGLA
ncbi:MAG: shikimate dehydrogenase [Deltaproteobacteria bacterium]|nr:shikimate dehydrogenase [Deltaproteobacteria bacterium]